MADTPTTEAGRRLAASIVIFDLDANEHIAAIEAEARASVTPADVLRDGEVAIRRAWAESVVALLRMATFAGPTAQQHAADMAGRIDARLTAQPDAGMRDINLHQPEPPKRAKRRGHPSWCDLPNGHRGECAAQPEPSAPEGLDVRRVKQAVHNVARRHGVAPNPPLTVEQLAVMHIFGYTAAPAELDGEIAAEYARLAKEATDGR